MGELNRIEQARLAYQKSHGFHEKHEEGFLRKQVKEVVAREYQGQSTKDLWNAPITLGAKLALNLGVAGIKRDKDKSTYEVM